MAGVKVIAEGRKLSVVPLGAVGRMGRIRLIFLHRGKGMSDLGWRGRQGWLAQRLSLLRGCNFSGRWREAEGEILRSGKWLTPQREDFLIPLAQSPRDLVFISFLAKEVALVQGALAEGCSCVTFL